MAAIDPIYLRALVMGAIIGFLEILDMAVAIKDVIEYRKAIIITGIVLICITIANGASASFAYNINPIYGIVHYGLILSYTISTLLYTYKIFRNQFISVIGFLIVITLFIIVIPVAVIPHFRPQAPLTSAHIPSEISTESFTKSFSRIRYVLSDIERKISKETTNIDNSIIALIKEINARNEQLRALHGEQSRLSEQVEYYRKLASLTEEQTQAVIQALQRGKYTDYIIGFIIGLLSSGVFFALQKFTLIKRQ